MHSILANCCLLQNLRAKIDLYFHFKNSFFFPYPSVLFMIEF